MKGQNSVCIFHLSLFLEMHSYAMTKVKIRLEKNNCCQYVWSNDFNIMLQPYKVLSSNKLHILLLVIHASLLSSV